MNIKQDFTTFSKQDFPWLPFLGAAIIVIIIMLALRGTGRHIIGPNNHFNTEYAQKRTIISIVKTQGILVPQDIIQIGNLIDGIVRYLYAEENDIVEEGQLLAEIDDSLEDSAVNSSFGNLDAAQAVLKYQWEFLKRQEQLYGCKQISLDVYQQAERSYQTALANVEANKGLYETQKLIYNNKRVHSPISGMIIARNVSVGQAVNNYSPPSVLYTVVKNTELKAYIFLDAHALEVLEPNMPVSITVDAYPHKTVTGPVREIINIPYIAAPDHPFSRFVPKTPPPTNNCAVVHLDNRDLSLRPSMTIKATITVAEKEDTLSIPMQALKITKQQIQQLAQDFDYHYQPLEGKELIDAIHKNAKTVWVLAHKTFVEKTVTTGVSDAEYIEITAGLDGSENVVCSLNECNGLMQVMKTYCTRDAKA
jgi:HlyD family secretion protein